MSIKNHPNFHIIQFLTDIMISYNKCLRNDKAKKLILKDLPIITDATIKFVEDIEDMVNDEVKKLK